MNRRAFFGAVVGLTAAPMIPERPSLPVVLEPALAPLSTLTQTIVLELDSRALARAVLAEMSTQVRLRGVHV